MPLLMVLVGAGVVLFGLSASLQYRLRRPFESATMLALAGIETEDSPWPHNCRRQG